MRHRKRGRIKSPNVTQAQPVSNRLRRAPQQSASRGRPPLSASPREQRSSGISSEGHGDRQMVPTGATPDTGILQTATPAIKSLVVL